MNREDRRLGDEDLVERTRSGDVRAFGVLWERHARAGLTAAGRFRSLADPEDIVAEAYLRILRAVQRGGGPREAFRPYLYRTIRNVALKWKSDTTSSLDDVDEPADESPGPEELAIGSTTTVRAFRALPERWQTVLWYTEVEGMEPAQAAPFLGLTANSTAALAYRARDGLKKAWLQAHVSGIRVPPECRWTTERMGEYASGGLTPRARVRFDEHLKTCARCTILLEEIDQLSSRLAAFLFPLVLGGAAGSALLAQRLSSGGGAGDGTGGGNDTASAARGGGSGGTTPMIASGPSRAIIALLAAAAVVLIAGGAFALNVVFPTAAPSASATSSAPARTLPTPPAVSTAPPAVAAPPVASAPPATVPAPVTRRAAPPAPPPVTPIDTTAPVAPVVMQPVDAALTSNPFVQFTGTGEPGAVVHIARLAADGVTVVDQTGSATVSADGSWVVTPTARIPDGTQPFRVTQVDAAGNVSPAAQRSITVDTIALPPTIDPPAAGPLFWLPDVTGQAEPSATVELADENGNLLGTATADASGAWSIPLPDPARDDETVTAVQTDLAGNRSTPSTAVGPFVFQRPTILQPVAGSTVPTTGGSTSVQVQISGVAGMQVEIFVDGISTGNIHTLQATPIVRVTSALPDGPHSIGVRYVDPATGQIGSMVTVQFAIG